MTQPHRGRYSDGRSAASSLVEVRLTGAGLEISGVAEERPLLWPYGELATGAPLGAQSRDVLVTSSGQKGATLFVDDASFAGALRARAPHLSARAVRFRHAAPWLWAFAGVVLLGAIVWMLDLSPARTLASALPDGTRDTLGAQVVRSMTATRKVCTTPSGRQALDRLVERLSQAAGGRRPFRVTVVDWGLVNAFATAGEQIVLTRGLIAKASSADEVAGVLAHEMGHGLELHPETALVRALGLSAAIELMSGGSSGTIANIGAMLAQFSYTRAAEREADRQALRILKGAQISPQGIIDFFTRVEKADGASGGAIDIMRTHPQIGERRRLAETQPRYPATPALAEADWQALRGICGS